MFIQKMTVKSLDLITYRRIKPILDSEKTGLLRGWSRKLSNEIFFKGVSDRIKLVLEDMFVEQTAEAITLARYGIGRYKNQGFGSLLISSD